MLERFGSVKFEKDVADALDRIKRAAESRYLAGRVADSS
jgi:hypothetical protein